MSVDAWYANSSPGFATAIIGSTPVSSAPVLGGSWYLRQGTSYTVTAYLTITGSGTLTLNLAGTSQFSGYFANFAATFPPANPPGGNSVSAPTVSGVPFTITLPGPSCVITMLAMVTVSGSNSGLVVGLGGLLTAAGASGVTVAGGYLQVIRVTAPQTNIGV